MRYSFLLGIGVFFLGSLLPVFGQEAGEDKGIHFFHGTLEELKKEAKEKNKLIFLDAYTSWCGPCKMMAAQTFTHEKVGSFFNKNFISYKLDMEQGEGPGFAVRYQVNAYPTLLFIDAKGNEVHRVLGFRNVEQLLAEAEKASDPSGNMALMKSSVESGSKDPEVLYQYATKLAEGGNDYQEVARRYFDTQSESALLSEKNWKAIQALTDSIDSREFQFVLKKKAEFVKKYGLANVEQTIYRVCARAGTAAVKNQNDTEFDKSLTVLRKYLADNGRSADLMLIEKAEMQKDWKTYGAKMVEFLTKFKQMDAKWLNEVAWNFYEHVEEPTQLEKALTWTKQSIALENQYYNNDTMAALFFKLGKYNEARKWANTAIFLARQSGENAESTEKLLEQIDEKLKM
jgi:thioredoxin-related protein